MPQSVQIKEKHFFSRSAGLTLWPTKSQRIIEDGQSKVIDGEAIHFHPVGDGFGQYSTDDPDVIAYLEDRATRVGDVFDEAKFSDLSTPTEVKLETAERTIQNQNRLLAELQSKIAAMEEGGAPSPKKSKS